MLNKKWGATYGSCYNLSPISSGKPEYGWNGTEHPGYAFKQCPKSTRVTSLHAGMHKWASA